MQKTQPGIAKSGQVDVRFSRYL